MVLIARFVCCLLHAVIGDAPVFADILSEHREVVSDRPELLQSAFRSCGNANIREACALGARYFFGEANMGEGSENLRRRPASEMSARDLFSPDAPETVQLNGRMLTLKFISTSKPQLDRIEFLGNASSEVEYRQRGDLRDASKSFKHSTFTEALSMLLLDYLCLGFNSTPISPVLEGGAGSHAATIGYAFYDKKGKWGSLFVENQATGKVVKTEDLFGGANWSGKPVGIARTVWVNPEHLPRECIKVFWNNRLLNTPDEVRWLTDRFRKAWNMPPPVELKPETGAETPPKNSSSKPLTTPPKSEPPNTTPENKFKIILFPPKSTAPLTPAPTAREPIVRPDPPLTRIDAKLLEIQNPDELEWSDSAGLVNFGKADSKADIWTIRDANEGLLIMGAVGSGKTSGSGAHVGTALLQAGYGGLILTAKTDEAQRWVRLCERTGRAKDCIHVTLGSGHKLNALQYEIQRPGHVSVTDDLVALLRAINAVASRSRENAEGDKFWTHAPNLMMKHLFEIFTLSGEPISISNFTRFINRAPQELGIPWQGLEYFSTVVTKAEDSARTGSDMDKLMFLNSLEYWTVSFPKIPEITRGGIIASFDAIAEVMNGRGIYEILCTETNLTPEMILSGKIVILDFPLKESSQGGLVIQATWKLLFQQAIERRADKNRSTARPVFLWEDEGHEFFSHHDVRFQPTARDCRACHVILSQNLHNFLHLGHGLHSVEAVFAAMNTFIFHANGDHETNQWASEKIGLIKEKYWGTNGLMKGFTDKDYDRTPFQQPEETGSVGHFVINEREEPGMRPEEFSKLKKGGDGTCEAVILWLSHQFAVNKNKSFCKRTFKQESRAP